MERQMAGQLQAQEREGEVLSREMEMDKQGTLLGMAQQDVAAYREQAAAARQAKWDAISGGVSSLGGMLTGGGGGGGLFGGGGGGGGFGGGSGARASIGETPGSGGAGRSNVGYQNPITGETGGRGVANILDPFNLYKGND